MIRAIPLLALALLAGCGDPIAGCDAAGADCCTSDDDCADHYGEVFPFCVTPGRQTGICAECLTGDDCDVYEVCREDPVIGAFCVDRDAP